MTKQTDSTTSTTQSSSNVTTIVNLPALFYQWDGIKRTRKAAYTHYLQFHNKDYSNCPRQLKKARKYRAVRSVYYSKGGIYIFHPKLLSTPFPQGICDMFAVKNTFETSGTTMRFLRYRTDGEHD